MLGIPMNYSIVQEHFFKRPDALKVISLIEDDSLIKKILMHLGLWHLHSHDMFPLSLQISDIPIELNPGLSSEIQQ
jgi:hypothetical protein